MCPRSSAPSRRSRRRIDRNFRITWFSPAPGAGTTETFSPRSNGWVYRIASTFPVTCRRTSSRSGTRRPRPSSTHRSTKALASPCSKRWPAA
ncbi:MAG TPA: hypothetical protein DEP84_28785, partial [Chloroflexi bacterium]|nr:hypothetical protein [Chloroflexota bacterium]